MKKIRYLQQRDRFRCGPIAIINTMKWLGMKASSKLLKRICRRCKCYRHFGGTHTFTFLKTMERYTKRHCYWINPTPGYIKSLLRDDELVVIQHNWWDKKDKEEKGHYFIVDKYNKKGYRVINAFIGGNIQYIDDKQMRRILRGHTWAWRISR